MVAGGRLDSMTTSSAAPFRESATGRGTGAEEGALTPPRRRRFNEGVLGADIVVADRFRMVRELGRGGMGSVWLAHHLSLDVPCAVKFVDEKLTAPALRHRFEAEARAAARLKGPHVVQILDHGVWEGTPYIAMELLEGEDLAARLHGTNRLSLGETATIVTHVARALMRAHATGVVHRDLKPANIFLTRDDEGTLVAKVLDFGIAKITEPSLKRAPDTMAGQLLGTPEYMSPEQFQGKHVDFRSDLWSLGVIAFECLTGVNPFATETLYAIANNVVHKPIPLPSTKSPDLPPRIDQWWERAVHREPSERFPNARDMAVALCLALGVTASDVGGGPGRHPAATMIGPGVPPAAPKEPAAIRLETPGRWPADTPTIRADGQPTGGTDRPPTRKWARAMTMGLVAVVLIAFWFARRPHRSEALSVAAVPASSMAPEARAPAKEVLSSPRPAPTAPAGPMIQPTVPDKAPSPPKAGPGTKRRSGKPADPSWDPGF
jgi:serine/threonine protein kinase